MIGVFGGSLVGIGIRMMILSRRRRPWKPSSMPETKCDCPPIARRTAPADQNEMRMTMPRMVPYSPGLEPRISSYLPDDE